MIRTTLAALIATVSIGAAQAQTAPPTSTLNAEMTGPPAAPAKRTLQVLTGTFSTTAPSLVPIEHCPSTGGTRVFSTTVVFYPPFYSPPQVAVQLNSLDAGNDRNLRVVAHADNVKRDSARIVVSTWCNTNLWLAAGTITAIGYR